MTHLHLHETPHASFFNVFTETLQKLNPPNLLACPITKTESLVTAGLTKHAWTQRQNYKRKMVQKASKQTVEGEISLKKTKMCKWDLRNRGWGIWKT